MGGQRNETEIADAAQLDLDRSLVVPSADLERDGLLGIVPDGRYEQKSFAVDEQRNNVTAFAVFHGTHTGEGGPVPPTQKETHSHYVYVLTMNAENKVEKMVKIWNAPWAMKELGWA